MANFVKSLNTLSSAETVQSSQESELMKRIMAALSGLEFGTVEIIVQDSRVVQIERTQRSRFAKPLEIPR